MYGPNTFGTRHSLNERMGMIADQQHETFLVLRAQAGELVAFDELLRTVQAPLYRYVSGLTGDGTIAEDVLQEVFILIYRKIGWLREPALFRPWAYRIASRETFARLKKEQRWREQVREEEVLESLPAAETGERASPEEIYAMLSMVSPASRAVLMLHYLEDLSLAETAEILGISIGTVKSRLAFGLRKLRETAATGEL